MKKKINIMTIIIFNIFALPLLIYSLIMLLLDLNFEIIPYAFGQIGAEALMMCVAFGITIEGIMLFVLAIINRRFLIFAPNFLLVPIVLSIVYLGIWSYTDTHEVKIEKYNETLIIDNVNLLLHGRVYIYEKDSWLSCKYICQFGDDKDYLYEGRYDIYEYDNGVEIKCYNISLFLKYENNSFIEVKTKEEIL